MQRPDGGIIISRLTGVHIAQGVRENYEWYGGATIWASYQLLTSVPIVGETIMIGPYMVRCIDKDDATETALLERFVNDH